MSAEIHLRPAVETDAGRVGAILSAFIDDTDWMPRIHTRAEDLSFAGLMISRGWVTVAKGAGVVQAFLARDDDMIHALYVAAGARGRGIGATLLEAAQKETRRLRLWTFQANSGAQSFYLRHGFTEQQRTDGARNDEHLPDIEYLWERT